MAAPDPLGVIAPLEVTDGKRLRVMDDEEVVFLIQEVGVHLVVHQIGLAGQARHLLGRPLQRVVKRLRDAEELGVAGDDLPVGVDPEALVDRDKRAQQLRHTAAIRGGVDLSDARPLQMAGQGTYLPCQLAADIRLIGPEANNADIHVVEHSPILSG